MIRIEASVRRMEEGVHSLRFGGKEREGVPSGQPQGKGVPSLLLGGDGRRANGARAKRRGAEHKLG